MGWQSNRLVWPQKKGESTKSRSDLAGGDLTASGSLSLGCVFEGLWYPLLDIQLQDLPFAVLFSPDVNNPPESEKRENELEVRSVSLWLNFLSTFCERA